MRRVFFFLILTSFLLSCTKSEKEEFLLYHESVNLQSEDGVLGRPFRIVMTDNYLVMLDGATEKSFHLIDIDNNQYVGSFGNHGSGPQELLNAGALVNVQGRIYFLDRGQYKEYEILLNSDVNKIELVDRFNVSQVHNSVIPMDSCQYATCGIYDKGWVKLFDTQENELSSSGDCPVGKDDENLSNRIRSFAYQGELSYNGKDKLVMATLSANQLYVFKIVNGTLNCTSSLVQSFPQYLDKSSDIKKETGRDGYGVSFRKENRFGYINLYAAQEGVYALFSGASIEERVKSGRGLQEGSKLMYYNYDLEEQVCYTLDIPLTCFTLDPRTNTIYGISNIPEATLVKFKLP